MNQRFLFYLVPLILLLAASGCKNQMQSYPLTSADADKEMNVKVGDQIIVTLDANPTTGYQWEWVSEEASILELVGEPEYRSEAEQNLVGAGGKTTFTFTAKTSGEVVLHLIYHRSFEQGVAPIEELQVKVTVE